MIAIKIRRAIYFSSTQQYKAYINKHINSLDHFIKQTLGLNEL